MHKIRCAYCDKVMRAGDIEIIFWKPGDRPYGLHKGCDKKYNEGPPVESDDAVGRDLPLFKGA